MHLLFHCGKVEEFWKNFKIWLERKANINLQIGLKNILFSSSAQVIVSYLITAAKYYIYESKFNMKNTSIKGLYIAKLNKIYDKFLGKWSSLYNYMISL